jgi:hypothetical protein
MSGITETGNSNDHNKLPKKFEIYISAAQKTIKFVSNEILPSPSTGEYP